MKLPASRPAKGAVTALAVLCTLLLVVAASLLSAQAAVRQCRGCQQAVHLTGVQHSGVGGADAALQGGAAAAAGNGAAAGQEAAATGEVAPGIPKIFHRIYIADPNDPKRSNFTMPIAHQRWVESCQYAHTAAAGWQLRFWDWGASEALIAEHYPWFLPFYQNNVSRAIEKSDLVRYAIMHHIGGLYIDSDVECFREGADLLQGHDAVFQATHSAEGVTNAAMAARPGLEVFTRALELVQERQIKRSDVVGSVIGRTGPDLLTAALEAVGLQRSKGMFERSYSLAGVEYRLYRVGTWFTPCQWWEQDCRRNIYRERASGHLDMRLLVGMHRLVGSWIPGKEDGIGIMNTTAELCGGGKAGGGGNGQIGGWVARPNKGRLRRRRD